MLLSLVFNDLYYGQERKTATPQRFPANLVTLTQMKTKKKGMAARRPVPVCNPPLSFAVLRLFVPVEEEEKEDGRGRIASHHEASETTRQVKPEGRIRREREEELLVFI